MIDKNEFFVFSFCLAMRLLTHNMLQCHVKNCKSDNFPLTLRNAQLANSNQEFNIDFLKKLLTKVDLEALQITLKQLNLNIPSEYEELKSSFEVDKMSLEFYTELHKILFTVVEQGEMLCEGCGHVYLIKDAIPNMLLSESEV
jgi:multifunctional methyltransferase subunit TRM112